MEKEREKERGIREEIKEQRGEEGNKRIGNQKSERKPELARFSDGPYSCCFPRFYSGKEPTYFCSFNSLW